MLTKDVLEKYLSSNLQPSGIPYTVQANSKTGVSVDPVNRHWSVHVVNQPPRPVCSDPRSVDTDGDGLHHGKWRGLHVVA